MPSALRQLQRHRKVRKILRRMRANGVDLKTSPREQLVVLVDDLERQARRGRALLDAADQRAGSSSAI